MFSFHGAFGSSLPVEAGRSLRCGVMWVLIAAVVMGWLAEPARAQATEAPEAPAARAPAETTKDRWYSLDMFGSKAGWMNTTERVEGDRIITSSRMQINLKRGEAGVKMDMESEFVETKEGKPISMRSVQNFGAMPITQEFTFKDDGVDVKSTQGGGQMVSTQPLPKGEWLTPAAAERYVLQRYKSGAKEIVVRVVSPEYGLGVVTATRTGFEPSKIEAMGRVMDVVKSIVENSAAPGVKSIEYTDSEGELVRSETQMMGATMVLSTTTKELAMATGKASAPPEVMASTMIKPKGEIKNPRRTTRGVFLLSVNEPPLPELPSVGAQRVERLNETSVRVTIDTKNSIEATPEDVSNPAFLKATALANIDDEEIKKLAEKSLKGVEGDPAAKADALRRAVHRHIRRKDLDVGFASASEVARNRQGDCSEHGVLLAALLRASGIPSRVAAGLIYADAFAGHEAIFGYHMWAQALIEVNGTKRWVDLDATLPGSTSNDATHITLGVSDLGDGDPTSGLATIAGVMGRLQIKVESIE